LVGSGKTIPGFIDVTGKSGWSMHGTARRGKTKSVNIYIAYYLYEKTIRNSGDE
jgi:hypothetical protein